MFMTRGEHNFLCYSRTSLLRTSLGLTNAVLNWEVSGLQRSNWMEMTNLGLKFGALNREVSSWQWCPLREIPLYFHWTLPHQNRCELSKFIKYWPCVEHFIYWYICTCTYFKDNLNLWNVINLLNFFLCSVFVSLLFPFPADRLFTGYFSNHWL
jgi:hypothetical protein